MPFSQGHALLIGVGTYHNEPRLNVPITAADAEAVAAVLRAPAFCGYPDAQVKVLHDATASRDGILAALDALAARAGEGDTVLLFFCGHGDLGDDGDYYLTTHDTRLQGSKVISGSGVRQGELIEKLRAVKAKRLLLLVNACHSGELAPTLGPGEHSFTGIPLPAQTAAALLADRRGTDHHHGLPRRPVLLHRQGGADPLHRGPGQRPARAAEPAARAAMSAPSTSTSTSISRSRGRCARSTAPPRSRS